MKRIALGICLLTASVCHGQASQGWNGRFYYDVSDHLLYGVTSVKLTTFSAPKFSLDLEAFAGAGVKDGKLTGGFDLGHSFKPFTNADIFLGVGFSVKQGERFFSSVGPLCGVTVRF